ncbi:MAG: hypothetical protein JSW11_20010 [Candidatus Heimdallarchaeota archaeon]|nr:MAG: hypothetical protein JSW11_20010 [Candidatus Heimdallarchaeota archaeon]
MKNNINTALYQLKIDYLQFMIQVQDWHDPNIILIVYALLMEKEKITQDNLIDLTGLSRTTISETLSLLINDPRGIPVLQTRKPRDKKKYYYCPLSFQEYVKRMFGGALKTINLNLEFVPAMIKRLNRLKPQDEATNHVKEFLVFFYTYNHFVRVVMEKYDEVLTEYFENPEKTPDIRNFLTQEELHLELDTLDETPNEYKETDSLTKIQRDFIGEMVSMGQTSSSGVNKELAYAFFLLYLSKSPITQEDLIKITKSRRAAVSEAFTLLLRQKFANLVKKPNDRRKYYEPIMNLDVFISQRLQLSRHKINQINLVMNNRFIPEVEKIEGDKEEKDKLKAFFQETGRYFHILGRYMTDMFEFIMIQLKQTKVV